MRKLFLLFVGILFTVNIFAGEPVKINDFNKTEWTIAYEDAGVQVLYMQSEIVKNNNEVSNFVIFKVVNNNNNNVKVTISMDITYGETGDIITKSGSKVIEISPNSFAVDASVSGETKLRVPLNYKRNVQGTPLSEINLNNIIIE